MIDIFMLLAFLLRADPAHVDRLVAFAPEYLDADRAREHVVAACLAAHLHRVDCSVLLAIAFNESRFVASVVGGVMGAQHAVSTVPDGYTAGAAALRWWIDEAEQPRHPSTVECRRRSSAWQCAMLGYAGGWNALDICSTRGHANCGYPDVVLRRARRIRGHDAPPY